MKVTAAEHIKVKDATVTALIEALEDLRSTYGDILHVRTVEGENIGSLTVFHETLSDGSTVYNAELETA